MIHHSLFHLEKLKTGPSFSEPCVSGYFQCHDNSKCIRDYWMCDNVNDCDDNSDESPLVCCGDTNQFHCGSGVCISQGVVCNGVDDCVYGEDERNCQPCELLY